MTRYAPLRFQPVFGLAAVALTVATMVLAIGVPAAVSPDRAAITLSKATANAIEVTIVPASIDVVGLRDESVASTPARRASHS